MPPPWLTSALTKNLDEDKHDLKTSTTKVYPMGDFRFNQQAKERRLENLMGTVPKQERNEIKNNDLNENDRPLSEIDEALKIKERARTIASEASFVALKRDSNAISDEDGYKPMEGPPAFRDGFNNILRVKPQQEDHLHNGLKSLKLQTNASIETSTSGLQQGTVAIPTNHKERKQLTFNNRSQTTLLHAKSKSNDQVYRLSQKPDITKIIGSYFVKGISSESVGSKSRDSETVKSLFRHEKITDSLIGGGLGIAGVENKSDDLPETEEAKRHLILVSKALGSAFINLGMTLPAGKRDDPLRNDSIALELGNRLMMDNAAGHRTLDIPHMEESTRKEVAIALGRTILHLKAAAGIEASRGQKSIIDSQYKDRTIQIAVGQLTLQLLEASTSQIGKISIKDQTRREILANAIGKAIIHMEAGTIRKQETDRNKVELNVNMTNSATGPTMASKGVAFQPQKNNIIVHRAILPGKDSAPPDIERYKPIRA